MPTKEELLQYLGIDYPDGVINANAARCLATAQRTLEGAVGDDVLKLMPKDERARELVLIYAEDLYSQRGVAAKVSGATRRQVADMELQLRMELRVLREKAVVE